jgi:hypothetical protein
MVPSARFRDAESLVRHVLGLRYGEGHHLARDDNWAERNRGPFQANVLERVLQHPRAHIPDWVIDATIATIRYVVNKYGCAPAFTNPVRAKFSCQVHHVDLEYYRHFHVPTADEPYLVTPQIREHFRAWHPGAPDPNERSE